MFFDTHAHLDFPALTERLDDVVAVADAADVTRIVTIGASRGLESNYRAFEIAKAHERIWCTAGRKSTCIAFADPHDADMVTPEVLATIRNDFAGQAKVVGIGETGLDYHYDKADRGNQMRAFHAFLEMSQGFG